jgi:Caspase domain
MSHSTRRHFLQFASATLGTIALGSIESLTQAATLLAQPTGRKYALLIGIDKYESKPLLGCNTDVDLQRELLLHRYGFKREDIVELRDTEATYNNIITQFQTHLIQKAQPGDLVVFLFSGHGSIVRDPSPITDFKDDNGNGQNGTILPIDWKTPDPTKVREIMGKTLFLLSSQLKTDNVVMILDSCHSEGGLRGNSRARSLDTRGDGKAGYPEVFQAEIDLQTDLQKRLNWSDAELQKRRQKGAAKGVAMGAASFYSEANIIKLEALELSRDDFNAGAFTYLLTRYLWQASGNRSLGTDFPQIALSSTLNSKNSVQNPVYQVAPNSGNATKPIFFTAPSCPTAEGVIHEPPQGDDVKFWLGGASPDCLKAYETAVFNIIDPKNGQVLGELQQTRREGLVGHGKMFAGSTIQPQVGMLLQEKIRGIPDNLILKIGLDASLGDALPTIKQGLSEMPKIEIVSIGQQKEINYIIGRAKQTGRFHVLTPSLAIVSDPIGAANDSVGTVVDRLKGYIKTLQAKQLLKTMMGDASTMKISTDLVPVEVTDLKKATIRPIGPPQRIMSQSAIAAKPNTIVTAPTFPAQSSIQVRLQNQESKPLHMAVMIISADGSLAVVYPYGIEATDEALVAPNSEKILKYAISIQPNTDAFELLTIASRQPLDKLLKTVKRIAESQNPGSRGKGIDFNGDKSIEFAADMLADIDNISRGNKPSTDKKIVDMNQLTVVSSIVQVK